MGEAGRDESEYECQPGSKVLMVDEKVPVGMEGVSTRGH